MKREPNPVRSVRSRVARRLKVVDAIAADFLEMVAALPAPSREEIEALDGDIESLLPVEARLIGVLRRAHYYLAEACTVVRDYGPQHRPFGEDLLRQLRYEIKDREEVEVEELAESREGLVDGSPEGLPDSWKAP